MNYSDKLKDPRWQKLRLQILERDDWRCVMCKRTDLTLHVHHLRYEAGKEPWESQQCDLMTLCHICHEGTHGKDLTSVHYLRLAAQSGNAADMVTVLQESLELYQKRWKVLTSSARCLEILTRLVSYSTQIGGLNDSLTDDQFRNYETLKRELRIAIEQEWETNK